MDLAWIWTKIRVWWPVYAPKSLRISLWGNKKCWGLFHRLGMVVNFHGIIGFGQETLHLEMSSSYTTGSVGGGEKHVAPRFAAQCRGSLTGFGRYLYAGWACVYPRPGSRERGWGERAERSVRVGVTERSKYFFSTAIEKYPSSATFWYRISILLSLLRSQFGKVVSFHTGTTTPKYWVQL